MGAGVNTPWETAPDPLPSLCLALPHRARPRSSGPGAWLPAHDAAAEHPRAARPRLGAAAALRDPHGCPLPAGLRVRAGAVRDCRDS